MYMALELENQGHMRSGFTYLHTLPACRTSALTCVRGILCYSVCGAELTEKGLLRRLLSSYREEEDNGFDYLYVLPAYNEELMVGRNLLGFSMKSSARGRNFRYELVTGKRWIIRTVPRDENHGLPEKERSAHSRACIFPATSGKKRLFLPAWHRQREMW